MFRNIQFRFGSPQRLEIAHRLSIIKLPPPSMLKNVEKYVLFPDVDGGWWRVLASKGDGVETWEVGRAIELKTLLPKGALPAQQLASAPSSMPSAHVVGVAEGMDVTFVGTKKHDNRGAVYMVQLNSRRARKVYEKCTVIVPYTSFCIPVMDSTCTDEEGPRGIVSSA